MVFQTEFPTANQILQTDAEVQRNLWREYEQTFADLLEREIYQTLLPMLVSQRILTKYNSSLHLMRKDAMKTSCREYTSPRSEETSRVKEWIRENTKIGPILEVMVCYHQGRYGVEIKIESLFRGRTCSWVRVVNGINKSVTETSEEILAVLGREVQGNLLRRLDHDRHRP